jgi:phage terminase large subunit-like protein
MDKLTDIVQWAESSAGFYLPGTKQPVKLAGHQKDILRHVFTQQADGRLPYDTVVYACPKKSGKTTIAALVAEYFALFIEAPNEVYLCANDLEQSQGRSFKAMSQSVRLNPHLSKRAEIQKQAIYFDNETMVQALAADYAGAAGSNHGLSCWDELWAYVSERSRRMWDEMTPVPTRRISIRFIATYGGFTGESVLLEELYNQGQAGEVIPELAHIDNGEGQPACRKNGRTFVYWDHELKRHPGLTISPEEYHNEQRRTLRPAAFLRIHKNKFTSNESAFISKEQWEACYSHDVFPLQPMDDRRIVFAADASTTRDLTALVGAEFNHDTKTVDIVYVRVWKPVKSELRLGKPTVDIDATLGEEVTRLYRAGQVASIVADPFQLHTSILAWEKAGIKVIELAQNAGRVESDQALYDAIIGRTIRHFNHPELNEHMENAIAAETPRGYRLSKEKASRKIDLAVATSMARWGAVKESTDWFFS